MRSAAIALALLAVLLPHESVAQMQNAEGEIVLNLPRAIATGETAFIEVAIGAIGRGQSVEVTAAGRSLGVISPFGARVGQDAGTYTVPVPADAFRDGRLALRLTVRQGDTVRPPTAHELRGIKLSIAGAR